MANQHIVIVFGIGEIYNDLIMEHEEPVELRLGEAAEHLMIDDISTIDSIAIEVNEWLYDITQDPMVTVLLTLHDTPDDGHQPMLELAARGGATVIIACSDEEQANPVFMDVWDRYRIGEAPVWSNVRGQIRFREMP